VLSSRADGKKVFTVNTHFKSPRRRIQLHLMVQLRDPEKEVAAVYESVADDRKSLIQAAIVRIMKARKVHTHVELVGDVIAQVRSRFVPQVADVKENISVMLDREFIRRVDDRTYEYVA
jgi:cullin 1